MAKHAVLYRRTGKYDQSVCLFVTEAFSEAEALEVFLSKFWEDCVPIGVLNGERFRTAERGQPFREVTPVPPVPATFKVANSGTTQFPSDEKGV